jgi:hypothetical protein
MNGVSNKSVDNRIVDRRSFLTAVLGTCALTPLAPLTAHLTTSLASSLTKEQRDSMTPSQVIDELKKGNERFRMGKMTPRDYLAEKRSSAGDNIRRQWCLDASIRECQRRSFLMPASATRSSAGSQATL